MSYCQARVHKEVLEKMRFYESEHEKLFKSYCVLANENADKAKTISDLREELRTLRESVVSDVMLLAELMAKKKE